MSADRYVPKVGDRVRRSNWSTREYIDVTAIGRVHFLGDDEDGDEYPHTIHGAWVLVPKPTPWPELVINVYPDRSVGNYLNEADADRAAFNERIGRICVHADGTVTAVRTEATS